MIARLQPMVAETHLALLDRDRKLRKKGLCNFAAALQRAIVASILRVPKDVGEEAETYARRRCRVAGVFCLDVGEWSKLVAERIVSWHGHMQRNHAYSWANELCDVQPLGEEGA